MTKKNSLKVLQDIIENAYMELKPIPEPNVYLPPFDYVVGFLIETGLPMSMGALQECSIAYTKEIKNAKSTLKK